MQALLGGEPRFVSEYLAVFGEALVGEFYLEDPVRSESVYLLGLYIGPQNKRHVVAYIGVGSARTRLMRIARVDYTLPVPANGARLFGGDGSHVLPAEGPEFRYLGEPSNPEYLDAAYLIGADVATSAARGPQHRIEPWEAEIARLEAARVATEAEAAPLEAAAAAAAAARSSSSSSNSSGSGSRSGSSNSSGSGSGSRSSSSNSSGSGSGSGSGSSNSSGSNSSSSPVDPALQRVRNRLRTIHNALVFWRMFYPKILLQIELADILAPGRATPRSPVRRTPRRFRRRASTGNASSLALSTSGNRTRRARRRAPAAAAAEPRAPHIGPRRLPRDPVTGKIIRRRQAYSDPRATTTNRTESPRRPTPGRVSGYEGSNNTSRGRSPVSTESNEGPSTPGTVFSERRRST